MVIQEPADALTNISIAYINKNKRSIVISSNMAAQPHHPASRMHTIMKQSVRAAYSQTRVLPTTQCAERLLQISFLLLNTRSSHTYWHTSTAKTLCVALTGFFVSFQAFHKTAAKTLSVLELFVYVYFLL